MHLRSSSLPRERAMPIAIQQLSRGRLPCRLDSFCAAEFLHVKPGKGAAFVRTKLKNYVTGNTVERTFRGGESVATAQVEKTYGQFTYMDGDDVSLLTVRHTPFELLKCRRVQPTWCRLQSTLHSGM